MINLVTVVSTVAGPRQARGEVRQQERVPRVQQRVPATQGHEPREHQVLPEQRRRVDGRGAPAGSWSPGDHDPHRTELEVVLAYCTATLSSRLLPPYNLTNKCFLVLSVFRF